jgi:uncharacterized protein YcaQ
VETNVELTREQARRIAVRAQLLDGSAAGVLETVRRLGFLQLDPISTVVPPQHLVLFSRLGGAYDRAELERLLWEERKLFEWNAFVWPLAALPLVRARMRRPWTGRYAWERRAVELWRTNTPFRRYVRRELEENGPLLSRELRADLIAQRGPHPWWGTRQVTLMLEIMHVRGEIAVAGRRGTQRVWDLAERWYPETERIPLREAERVLAERRRRALGTWLEDGAWRAHPDAVDGPVPDRVTVLSPFDRLVHDRDRAEALFGFHYRLEMYVPKAKREYGYYVLPVLRGDRLVGRLDAGLDRRSGRLVVNNVWAEPGEPFDESKTRAATERLAKWLGAELGKWPRVRLARRS